MKKKISLSLFSCLWLIILALLKVPYILSMICAVALHESGHLLYARLKRIPILSFELSMLGAQIKIDPSRLSYPDELLLAAAGPLAGLLGSAVCLPLSNVADFLLPFSVISLCLSLFNLIPIDTLDGGRILRCAVSLLFSPDAADRALRISSFITLFVLWLFAVYLMLRSIDGLTVFAFSAILFVKFFIFEHKKP